MTSFEIKASFKVPADVLFKAWLDSTEHSNMTGGAASCTDHPGDEFSAWDGYISGKNLEVVPHSYIKQEWTTRDFNESDVPSILEIRIAALAEGCEVTLTHSQIPEGQPDYEQGWEDSYFAPMREYFSKRSKRD